MSEPWVQAFRYGDCDDSGKSVTASGQDGPKGQPAGTSSLGRSQRPGGTAWCLILRVPITAGGTLTT